ncbi:LytTR family DNA-binding domain-containing protein [Flagellimonas meishanensis]|uniref:LytTR family DNA-binding domain-containing protein n=1 Tax=Flagellimonas meishanensis TaxID=2873264 RepID=UPI001CA76F1A|nr:LytTR family DNA-binding domain-containing protein [[Muricauda] meishanensis]
MGILNQFIGFFKKPFPFDTGKVYLRNSVVLSVFVTFFLFIFQPFGIQTLESNKFPICLGFGSMTFIAAMLYDLVVYRLLGLRGKQQDWTLGKWIIHNLGIMLLISLANFLFARILIIGYIDWSLFPTMIYSTFMIGIIPITVLGVITVFNQERKYQGIANHINQKNIHGFRDVETRNRDFLEIPTKQIRYIEALQNYVKVYYIDSKDQLRTVIERTTLKEVLAKAKNSGIVKCHRSYLVNKNAIVSTSGNAQGLLLALSGCNHLVPVSRSFVSVFR